MQGDHGEELGPVLLNYEDACERASEQFKGRGGTGDHGEGEGEVLGQLRYVEGSGRSIASVVSRKK